MEFYKMHGIGNDYIYFNCLNDELDDPNGLAIKLSDRHFGVGGDGIVMICRSDIADAKMRMFNLDGSEGKMCGNAIRCVGKFLYDKKIVDKTKLDIDTLSGIKYLDLNVIDGKVDTVRVNMGLPILEPENIPAKLDNIVNTNLVVNDKTYKITCVSMGNPHCVIFVDDVDGIDLEKIGPYFENHEIFPERVNTEFVQILEDGSFKMRVWERGSGETLACGTGACAVAVGAVLNGLAKKSTDIVVRLRGGELIIEYTDVAVYMTGGATFVFKGELL
ncbi:MAG: diaminopimelate epimerase [Epulopiscium sp. Nuni2H_MBin003]|nr:MAG: diaminopimelate epimerase [Epulopiscium sp. Nuni2H_MBin003]